MDHVLKDGIFRHRKYHAGDRNLIATRKYLFAWLENTTITQYQDQRRDWADEFRMYLKDTRIPVLAQKTIGDYIRFARRIVEKAAAKHGKIPSTYTELLKLRDHLQ